MPRSFRQIEPTPMSAFSAGKGKPAAPREKTRPERCIDCKVKLRGTAQKAADFPGTRVHAAYGRCSTCNTKWRRKQGIDSPQMSGRGHGRRVVGAPAPLAEGLLPDWVNHPDSPEAVVLVMLHKRGLVRELAPSILGLRESDLKV